MFTLKSSSASCLLFSHCVFGDKVVSYTHGISQFHKGHFQCSAAAVWWRLPKGLEGPAHGVRLGRSGVLPAGHLGSSETGREEADQSQGRRVRVKVSAQSTGIGTWTLPPSCIAGGFGKIRVDLRRLFCGQGRSKLSPLPCLYFHDVMHSESPWHCAEQILAFVITGGKGRQNTSSKC